MKTETQRLELVALDARQLNLWVSDISALEKELEAEYRADEMKGFFLDIVKGQLIITTEDSSNYLWHTFWLIIRKSDRTIIGSADFKNLPDKNQEVEIGYGLGKPFEHKGYMTETVSAMCHWALSQNGVQGVIAETESENLASQGILKRCGFSLYSKGNTLWWRLKKTSNNN